MIGADGNPASRIVHCFGRDTGILINSGESDISTGAYEVLLPDGSEVLRVVLADETELYNDLVDRVIPG